MTDQVMTITGEAYKVRALCTNGKMLFAARDIVSICGIEAPGRWVTRANSNGEYGMERHRYPAHTTAGRRKFYILFVDANGGRQIVSELTCSAEAQKWLETNVFSVTSLPEDSAEQVESEVDRPKATNTVKDKGVPKEHPVTQGRTDTQTQPASHEQMSTQEQTTTPKQDTMSSMNRRIDTILIELLEIKKLINKASA